MTQKTNPAVLWSDGQHRQNMAVRTTLLVPNISALESIAAPLLGPNNFSYIGFASNLGNSLLCFFSNLKEFPCFLNIRKKLKNRDFHNVLYI